MTAADLLKPLALKHLNPETDLLREVTSGCVCDLLSVVMAKGDAGMAWITVQTHINVIAVASLHDFACVIVADGGAVEPEVLEKATEEGIPVLQSLLSEYTLSGRLYELGVR